MRILRCSALGRVLPVLLPILGACAAGELPADEHAAWIWANDDEASQVWLRRGFELTRVPPSATLWATCDNRMELSVNGTVVATSSDWTKPIELDVASQLRAGENELLAWGGNNGGPAGFCLVLELAGDEPRRIVSNAGWSASSAKLVPTDGWHRAVELGPYGEQPWGVLGPARAPSLADPALAADQIDLAPGFRAELLYSIPRVRQGSWVSLTADPRGRLLASDQYGGLFRITPPALGVSAEDAEHDTIVEPLELELGEAQGLLFAFDSLYVVVNAGGTYESGLYRARDSNGDDRFDEVRKLASFNGSGEHGPHAVLRSPDGKSLTVVAGNHTGLPEPITRWRPAPVWAEDQVLPRLPDPRGHATEHFAPGGWVARVDPDGESWELVAVGFRNPYDIAFDAAGELFTFDSDMEWDVGMPWYRPTRVLHVTSGAEFGWRNGSGKWPASYPDSLSSVVDVGPSSPTGIAFGTGAAFPARWRDALFIGDWAYGAIYAVHMEPEGASYRGAVEPFVRGAPLPVTDLAVGGDGALYFTTGGRRTQSGLYRVVWEGQVDGSAATGNASSANDAARLRASLERFHGVDDASCIDAAFEALDHADRHVRFAARTALESQDPALWRERALEESRERASIEALLGLVRVDLELDRASVVPHLESWDWLRDDPERTIAALRVVGVALARAVVDPEDVKWLGDVLVERFPDGDPALDRELARVLAAVGASGWVEDAVALLDSSSQRDALGIANALRAAEHGWTEATRERFFEWFGTQAIDYRGGASLDAYVDDLYAAARATQELPEQELDRTSRMASEVLARDADTTWSADDVDALVVAVEDVEAYDRDRARLFFAQACAECHRFDGEGGATGPDLTGSRSRFSARDFLDAVLDPSATISDQYRDTELRTRDGTIVVGRVEASSDDRVVVRTAADERVELALDEVEERRLHALSRMPDGLFDGWSRDDVVALTAYVLRR